MDNIKILNLSDELQEPYRDLIQDLEWTIGEYSFTYKVDIEESTEDYAQLVVEIKDKAVHDIRYNLSFRIYEKGSAKINRYEDVWDDESRESIWQMLFFEASRKV